MYDNLIFCVRNGECLFDTHENKKKKERKERNYPLKYNY